MGGLVWVSADLEYRKAGAAKFTSCVQTGLCWAVSEQLAALL